MGLCFFLVLALSCPRMMSIDMPTKCWFIRWYLFHVDDMKNGETSTVRREVPCRIFSRQQYLPLLLPGTGNHRSRTFRPGGMRQTKLMPRSSPLPSRKTSSSRKRPLKLSPSPKRRAPSAPGLRCGTLRTLSSVSRPGPHKESTGPRPHPGNVLPPPGRQARRKYDPGKVRHPPQEKAAVQGSEA